MNKRRFLFVALFCLCVCSVDVGRGIYTMFDYEADELRETILEEIEGLGEHEWAGEYFFNDWHENISFYIAPEAGYLFEIRGVWRFHCHSYGKVTTKEGKIRLSLKYDTTAEEYAAYIDLFVVDWGDRRYLVSPDKMIGFCNDVNSKGEPRDSVLGNHLFRKGDEKKEVAGAPNVPKEFKKYLLKKSINAKIISVGKTITHKISENVEQRETPVTLNAGKDCGLLAGMKLHGIDRHQVFESVTITEVYDETSKGVIKHIFENRPLPECGWKFSTLPSWGKALKNEEQQSSETGKVGQGEE